MNPFLRNFTTLLGGNGLAFAVQLGSAPLLTRLFSAEDFGVYANVMAVAALLAVFGAGRYEQAIVQAGGNQKSVSLARLCVKLSLISCAASFVPLWLFRSMLWKEYHMEPKQLLWVVPLVALGTLLYGILVQLANSQGQYKRMALAKLCYALFVASCSALLGWLNYGAEGLVTGVLAGYALTLFLLIPQWIAVWKDRTSYTPSLAHEYRDFPRWNMPLAAMDTLNQQFLFNLLFTSLFGLKAMGWYAVTWRYLRAPARLVHSSAAQLFYREASVHKDDSEAVRGYFNQTLRNTALFAIPLVGVLILAGPALFAFVLGEDWRQAGEYAQVMAPLIGLGMVGGAVSTVPLVFDRQRTFTIASISGQVLALAGLYVSGKWIFAKHPGHEFSLFAMESLGVYVAISCAVYLGLLVCFRSLIRNAS